MRSVGNRRKWLIDENQEETSIQEGLSSGLPPPPAPERGTLSNSLIWVSLPLVSNSPLNLGCQWGPGAMAVTVCAGSGAHRGSIHGGNRSLAPGHTPKLNLSLLTNRVQKAEEKSLQPPAQLMAEQRYPSHPLCSFLLILLSLNSEIPGRGQSLCQTAWSRTRHCG